MDRYFNKYYDYDGIELWEDEAWEGRGAAMTPLLTELIELSRKSQEAAGTYLMDRYADRHDEKTDPRARSPFFEDVMEGWKAEGMQIVLAGMVNLAAVPMSVIERRNHDPKVLLVPFNTKANSPHWAMNVLKAHEDLIRRAAKEEVLILFLATDTVSLNMMLQETGLEAEGLFRISMDPVYMDISELIKAGKTLQDVPGLDWAEGASVSELIGVPVADVSDKWQGRIAHQYIINNKMYAPRTPKVPADGTDYTDPNNHRPAGGVPGYNDEMHIHSTAGRIQAESMMPEHEYDSIDDPRFLASLDKRGLKLEKHPFDHGFWMTLTPKSCFDLPDDKIPLLCVMKEPRLSIAHQNLTALQFYYPFIDIAANGEFIMLFFGLETPDDNDMLADIIHEAAAEYPVDLSRVYITGQSHNGYYALEFYRRHPDIIAAAATLCDPIPLETGALIPYTGEEVPSFKPHDMPLININGQLENKMTTSEYGSDEHRRHARRYIERLDAFNALNMYTEDEIMAARKSANLVTRISGIPADRTEILYHMGTELYVSDILNKDGKWHLRFVVIENTPHMIMPQMGEVAWTFLRRFARDLNTGETIERY